MSTTIQCPQPYTAPINPVLPRSCVIGFIAVMMFSILVLGVFYNRSWLPHDEGAYAHVAQRILQGEVLNREVQDVHAGYINFANALALWLFGDQLISLRYPLVMMTLLQTCLIYLLLVPRGVSVAMAGAVSMASLSAVQFLNPTANWYALFFFVLIICCLHWIPRETTGRLELTGFLVLTLFLFRQLSGVFAGIGVITYLICEVSKPATRRQRVVAASLMLVISVTLIGYLIRKSDWVGILGFGIWPLCLLLWAGCKTTMNNRQILALLGRFAVGGAIAAAPLFFYHLYHHSLASWFDDTVMAATALTNLDFIHQINYAMFVTAGLGQLLHAGSLSDVLNGCFWLIVPLLATLLGLMTLYTLSHPDGRQLALHPLPFLSVFYALVSVHFQASMYLFYSVPLTLAGLLWLTSRHGAWCRYLSVAGCAGLVAVGLYYQAGQPVSRGEAGIIRGARVALVASPGLRRSQLWMEASDVKLYGELLALIEREVSPDGSILVLPVNPELYYLSGRKNPTRFFNAALGIRNPQQLQSLLRQIERAPPRLVFFRPDNVYNTPYVFQVMRYIESHYERLASIEGFQIYRFPG